MNKFFGFKSDMADKIKYFEACGKGKTIVEAMNNFCKLFTQGIGESQGILVPKTAIEISYKGHDDNVSGYTVYGRFSVTEK